MAQPTAAGGGAELEFQAVLAAALGQVGDHLSAAYERNRALHSVEKQQLADEVRRLRAELQALSGGLARPCPAAAGAVDPLPDPVAVVEPPPSARMVQLFSPTGAATAVACREHVVSSFTSTREKVVTLSTDTLTSNLSREYMPAAEHLSTMPSSRERVVLLSKDPFHSDVSKEYMFGDCQSSIISAKDYEGPVLSNRSVTAKPSKDPRQHLETNSEATSEFSQSQISVEPGSDLPPPPPLTTPMRRDRTYESFDIIHQRLAARLGQTHTKGMITGRELHQAVSALGLERYKPQEMDYLIYRLGVAINLKFKDPPRSRRAAAAGKVSKQLSIGRARDNIPRAGSMDDLLERAEWKFPENLEFDPNQRRISTFGAQVTVGSRILSRPDVDHSDKVLPMRALLKFFMTDEAPLRKLIGPHLVDQLFAIKEVLLTGDTNRLVAELTCVRIDDLATRRPEAEGSSYAEILVAVVVLANGILVGMQTDPNFENWSGWLATEIAFTTFFFVELMVRGCIDGPVGLYCGHEKFWSFFDTGLVAVGVVDCALSLQATSRVSSAGVLRFVRVARLWRLVRVFRLRFMRDLQLMVKGVLSGTRTLFWAFVLLLFVLYVLGIVTTTVFRDSDQQIVREMFRDVPTSMVSSFRCVSGDCFTAAGNSLAALLFNEYGVPFAMCLIGAFMTVTLGLFNVILAIYVETTMTAAKRSDEQNKNRHERESIRVAHITKRLLKMFCAAERMYNKMAVAERSGLDLHSVLVSTETDEVELDNQVSICKELFLLVIQDPAVQKMMDELDIPPDRAALFDSIDADASGNLRPTELVMGLLKVRGEIKKSDQVACILALRNIQNTLKELDANQRAIMGHIGPLPSQAGGHPVTMRSFSPKPP